MVSDFGLTGSLIIMFLVITVKLSTKLSIFAIKFAIKLFELSLCEDCGFSGFDYAELI